MIEFDRHELGTIIMALGWAEALIKSEAAFPDYVHCTRSEFQPLIAELVNAVKSPEAESDDVGTWQCRLEERDHRRLVSSEVRIREASLVMVRGRP